MLKRAILSYGLIIITYVLCLIGVRYFLPSADSESLGFITTCFFILSAIFISVDNFLGGKDKFYVGLGSTVSMFFLRLLLILGIVLYLRNKELTWSKSSVVYVVFAMILFMIIEKFIVLNEKIFGKD